LQIQNQNRLENKEQNKDEEQTSIDVWSLYLYAMKSPITREKYTGRLSRFFEWAGLEGGNAEEKARRFVIKSDNNMNWAFTTIIRFLQFQTNRINQREISAATCRSTE
jgi:hypothetical protein